MGRDAYASHGKSRLTVFNQILVWPESGSGLAGFRFMGLAQPVCGKVASVVCSSRRESALIKNERTDVHCYFETTTLSKSVEFNAELLCADKASPT